MSLNVELELLSETHTHRGVALVKGDKFDVDPTRAQRMIDAGVAKKVGVVEKVSESAADDDPVVEAEDAEVPQEADEGDE